MQIITLMNWLDEKKNMKKKNQPKNSKHEVVDEAPAFANDSIMGISKTYSNEDETICQALTSA